MKWKAFKQFITSGDFLYHKALSLWLWFGLSLYATLFSFYESQGINGNYKIFKHVFIHLRQQQNLYLEYPLQYWDVNLYGPFFSLVIAPFALLPDWLGIVVWSMANATFLFFALQKLPLKPAAKTMIVLLCSHEIMTSSSWVQFNPTMGACIILSFYYVNKGKEQWAAFFILFGTFIKLYSIVGLAFFFFSKNKTKFILWCIVWSVIFFVLPMLITKPSFVVQCYIDWKDAIIHKSARNIRLDIQNDYQDISVMGMIRRIFHYTKLNDSIVLLTAVAIFLSQYFRYQYFTDMRYRLYILCSVLLTVVIFSTSSEAPTYIIAFPAVCIWYAMQYPTKWNNALLIFAFLITSFSYSDLLTPWFRTNIARPYSIKALPCFILWIIIWIQIYSKQFLRTRPLFLNSDI